MVSLKLWDAKQPGFTLLELVLLIGLLAVILAIGLPVSINFYSAYRFQTEINTVAVFLEQVRNLALTNHGESAWGLYISNDDFIVFQGESYAAREPAADRVFDRANGIVISGPTELVFAALSGRTASSTLIISDDRRSASIRINSEGAISY